MGGVLSYENNESNGINNRDRQLLNTIYNNNNTILPSDYESANQVSVIIEQQKSKKTKAYKNPILLKRNTLKIEKDAVGNNYYFNFEYTSKLDFDLLIYFNSEHYDSYVMPSEPFKSKIITIKVEKGSDISFTDKKAYIDMDYFIENKIYDKMHTDVIIELIAYRDNGDIECILATYCKIIPEFKGERTIYRIKSEYQKLKIKNHWYEMHDIYGFPSDSSTNDCEICCSNKRNTIFLPCKHSYACSNCAINIRLRGNVCPICRLAINDSIIVENESKET